MIIILMVTLNTIKNIIDDKRTAQTDKNTDDEQSMLVINGENIFKSTSDFANQKLSYKYFKRQVNLKIAMFGNSVA